MDNHLHPQSQQAEMLEKLIQQYFSNTEKRLKINEGDYLFRRHEPNDRLYLVLKGILVGRIQEADGTVIETFKARRKQFVGVNSFFSGTFVSTSDVIALEDTEVSYIDHEEVEQAEAQDTSISERFMPVIIQELLSRQRRIQRMARENERAYKTLIQKEKMASLGQISAGIAHELNNAIAVLLRNTQWLSTCLIDVVQDHEPEALPLFREGLHHGRTISTREARNRKKELKKRYKLDEDLIDTLAATSLSFDDIDKIIKNGNLKTDQAAHAWELGATLSDMRIAADHANHVVKSIKALGAQKSTREPGIQINECVHEAQALLSSVLRKINVYEELHSTATLTGNHGELVQVIINLMNNACEAMLGAKVENPTLHLITKDTDHDIILQVRDNGPGIPYYIRERMFEPRITTKTDGTSIGLGLGLAIVQRLVESYDGNITVESIPGRTEFSVHLPRGGKNE